MINKLKTARRKRVFLLPNFKFIDLINPFYIDRKSIYDFLDDCSKKYQFNRVLDFGCGMKPYQSLFGDVNYVGLDIEKSGHANLNKCVDIFYNGHDIPIEDDYFDLILSTQVFEHVENIDEILKECYRVLKPSGHMLLTVPFCFEEHEKPCDFWRFTTFGIEAILKRASFEIIESKKSTNYIDTLRVLKITYCIEKYINGKNLFNYIHAFFLVIIYNFIFCFRGRKRENDYKGNLFLNTFVVCRK